MADVFISYDRVAHDAAALIAVKLRQLRVDVWFDVRARPEEAQKAKVVLVCWSRAAMTSELVRDEAVIGQRGGKLIGCFLEQVALSPPFSPPQTENLTNWNGQDDHPGWERLLQRIGERLGRTDLGGGGQARPGARMSAPPAPPPFIERRPPERTEGRSPPPRMEPPQPERWPEPPPHQQYREKPREPSRESSRETWPEQAEQQQGNERVTDSPKGKRIAWRGNDPWGDTWSKRPAREEERSGGSRGGSGSEPDGPPKVRTRDPGEGEISGPGGLKISFGIDKPARGDGKRDGRREERAPEERARDTAPKRDEFSFSTPGQSASKSTDWFSGSGEAEAGKPSAEFSVEVPGAAKGGDFFAGSPAGFRDEPPPRRRRRSSSGKGSKYGARYGGGGVGRLVKIVVALSLIGVCVFGAAYVGTTYLSQTGAAARLDFLRNETPPLTEVASAPAETFAPETMPTLRSELKAGAETKAASEAAAPNIPPSAAAAPSAAPPARTSVTTATAAATPPRVRATAATPAPPRALQASAAPTSAEGDVIDRLKSELRRLGLAADGGTGVLGRRSVASIRALQTAIGFRPTGHASEALVRRASALQSCQTQRGLREMSFRRPVNGAAEAGSRAECCAAANLAARTNAASSGLGYVRNWPSVCGNLGNTANAKLAAPIQGPARDNGTYTECQAAQADAGGAPGLYRCTVTGQVSCLYQAQVARGQLVCE